LGADPATAHYDLALVCLALKEPRQAIEELRRVLVAVPEHPEAHGLLERLQKEP
jgi:Tetratricopeptide repeat